MKFGKFLKRNQVNEWADFHVNYKGLKKLIAGFENSSTLESLDETQEFFHSLLTKEMYRVNEFFQNRLQYYYKHFDKLTGTDRPKPSLVELHALLKDLIRLKDFGYLNSEGLRKICKKFDKRCKSNLKEKFVQELYQNTQLKDSFSLQDMIEKISFLISTSRIPWSLTKVHKLNLDLAAISEARNQVRQALSKCEKKHIIVPMTVEPRTYLANERTYLKWLRAAILICVAGLSLLKFGHDKFTGLFCIISSLLLMFRSYWVYKKRLAVIIHRNDEKWWEDHVGPQLVLFLITFPVCTYMFYLLYFHDFTYFQI